LNKFFKLNIQILKIILTVPFESGYDEREMQFRLRLTDNEYALLKKNKMENSKIK